MMRLLAFLALSVAFLHGALIPAHAAKRVALVIGNSAYEHAAPLANPKNDADAIATKLEELGFEVVKGTDLTYPAMRKTLRDFTHKLQGAEVSLFFYAGHGLQVNGNNFLAPIDARLGSELDLEFETIKLSTVMSQMELSTKTNLVFLDACRDNPLARNLARNMGTRSTSIGRGLAREDTGVGTMIAFATQPGNVAQDGEGKNSPFTRALLKHVETPGLDVALVMRKVREDVIEETGGKQVPWNNSSLTGTFIFNAKARGSTSIEKSVEKRETNSIAARDEAVQKRPAVDRTAVDLALWESAKETDTPEAYEAYLERFPDGSFSGIAKVRLNQARKDVEPDPQQKQEEKELEMAALKKAEAEPATPEEPQDPRELTLALQTELKRVGCDPGQLDGQWGPKGRAAMTRFNSYSKQNIQVALPSREAIDAVKGKTERVCPVPIAKPVKRAAPKRKVVKKKPVAPKKPAPSTAAKSKSCNTAYIDNAAAYALCN